MNNIPKSRLAPIPSLQDEPYPSAAARTRARQIEMEKERDERSRELEAAWRKRHVPSAS